MGSGPRLSYAGLRILRLFMGDPSAEVTGAQIMKASGLPSGTVYPLLLRFERVGFLQSHWESGDPSQLGHPRRRYYRISRDGLVIAQKALQELNPTGGTLAPEAI